MKSPFDTMLFYHPMTGLLYKVLFDAHDPFHPSNRKIEEIAEIGRSIDVELGVAPVGARPAFDQDIWDRLEALRTSSMEVHGSFYVSEGRHRRLVEILMDAVERLVRSCESYRENQRRLVADFLPTSTYLLKFYPDDPVDAEFLESLRRSRQEVITPPWMFDPKLRSNYKAPEPTHAPEPHEKWKKQGGK
jgi:hypothetical protein